MNADALLAVPLWNEKVKISNDVTAKFKDYIQYAACIMAWETCPMSANWQGKYMVTKE